MTIWLHTHKIPEMDQSFMNGIRAESSDVLLAIPAYDGNEMALTIMRHSARTRTQLPAYLICCNRRTRLRILVKEYKLFQGKEIPCKTFHLPGLMSFQNSHARPGDYCFTILGQLFNRTTLHFEIQICSYDINQLLTTAS